jgi:hypothetical protein
MAGVIAAGALGGLSFDELTGRDVLGEEPTSVRDADGMEEENKK